MNRNLILRTLAASALLVASAGAVQAGHDRPAPARVRLAETAHDLEIRAANLERFASRFASPWDYRERILMRDLDRLADRTRAFHDLVEARTFAPARYEWALDDVVRAYDRVARSLERVRMPGAVYGRFDRLGDLLEDTQRLTLRVASFRGGPRAIPHRYRAYAGDVDRDDDGRHARARVGDDDDRAGEVRARPRRLTD